MTKITRTKKRALFLAKTELREKLGVQRLRHVSKNTRCEWARCACGETPAVSLWASAKGKKQIEFSTVGHCLNCGED